MSKNKTNYFSQKNPPRTQISKKINEYTYKSNKNIKLHVNYIDDIIIQKNSYRDFVSESVFYFQKILAKKLKQKTLFDHVNSKKLNKDIYNIYNYSSLADKVNSKESGARATNDDIFMKNLLDKFKKLSQQKRKQKSKKVLSFIKSHTTRDSYSPFKKSEKMQNSFIDNKLKTGFGFPEIVKGKIEKKTIWKFEDTESKKTIIPKRKKNNFGKTVKNFTENMKIMKIGDILSDTKKLNSSLKSFKKKHWNISNNKNDENENDDENNINEKKTKKRRLNIKRYLYDKNKNKIKIKEMCKNYETYRNTYHYDEINNFLEQEEKNEDIKLISLKTHKDHLYRKNNKVFLNPLHYRTTMMLNRMKNSKDKFVYFRNGDGDD